jgi:hypothetical protein
LQTSHPWGYTKTYLQGTSSALRDLMPRDPKAIRQRGAYHLKSPTVNTALRNSLLLKSLKLSIFHVNFPYSCWGCGPTFHDELQSQLALRTYNLIQLRYTTLPKAPLLNITFDQYASSYQCYLQGMMKLMAHLLRTACCATQSYPAHRELQ